TSPRSCGAAPSTASSAGAGEDTPKISSSRRQQLFTCRGAGGGVASPASMDGFFGWLEATALSTWLRDSPSLWAFPFVLILHTVGLAFMVGANVAWDVRALGFLQGVRLQSMQRYFLVMWSAFWLNASSGLLLLIAYPTKALTNPLFYVKLTLIGAGLVLAQH